MPAQPQTQALVPLLSDQAIVVESPQAGAPPLDRAAEWSRAFNQWLAEFTARNTRAAYERAWRDLLDYTGKFPWAIKPDDIRDWLADLGERPLNASVAQGLQKKGRRDDRYGYAPSTISQYLAAVSSFFTFASTERYLIIGPDGRETPLHHYNPARAIRRPKTASLGQKSDYLPVEDLYLLLNAIQQDTLQGLRDYALFLGYVFTGRRNSEWRTLTWGDLEQKGGKTTYVWSGKGKSDMRYELPPPVFDAICKYLRAAGRLDDVQPDHHIFTPLNDRATRLVQISALTWDRNRPLSMGSANKLLKKYARLAGLNATRISVHVLRHSAAMMLDHLGYDVRYICDHLAHSSLEMTMHYLDHLKGRDDESWRTVAAALKVDLMQSPP